MPNPFTAKGSVTAWKRAQGGRGATCTQGGEEGGIRERRGPSLDSSTDPIITLNQLVKFDLHNVQRATIYIKHHTQRINRQLWTTR